MKKLEIGLMAALLLFPAIGTAEAYTAETLKQAQGPAIVSESYKDGTMEVRKAVSKDANLLRRARINSAIDTEIDRFGNYVAKANQRTGGGTKGWINYKEGMTGGKRPVHQPSPLRIRLLLPCGASSDLCQRTDLRPDGT
ncbi:MAG: hypothetical protein LKE16_07295 [Dialister sp.]|jgi:hypothetical protein|nr:hypothetical protein [Dialister sp.]